MCPSDRITGIHTTNALYQVNTCNEQIIAKNGFRKAEERTHSSSSSSKNQTTDSVQQQLLLSSSINSIPGISINRQQHAPTLGRSLLPRTRGRVKVIALGECWGRATTDATAAAARVPARPSSSSVRLLFSALLVFVWLVTRMLIGWSKSLSLFLQNNNTFTMLLQPAC